MACQQIKNIGKPIFCVDSIHLKALNLLTTLPIEIVFQKQKQYIALSRSRGNSRNSRSLESKTNQTRSGAIAKNYFVLTL
ncbi:MAG: hypothetical protein ACRC2R_01565 [Xenococcaceae cyanobacterium]